MIGEQEQRIDMKVIEPYRRVISHGGSQALCGSGNGGTGSLIFLLENETGVLCSMTSHKPYWAVSVQGTVELNISLYTRFYKHCKADYAKITFQCEKCFSYHRSNSYKLLCKFFESQSCPV